MISAFGVVHKGASSKNMGKLIRVRSANPRGSARDKHSGRAKEYADARLRLMGSGGGKPARAINAPNMEGAWQKERIANATSTPVAQRRAGWRKMSG